MFSSGSSHQLSQKFFPHQQNRHSHAKIKLRKNKKSIPQIRINLDNMLTEAYTQINQQPTKKKLIGSIDIPFLPNGLIRQYIFNVYDQYSIPDPVKQRSTPSKNPSPKKFEGVRKRLFETPKQSCEKINSSRQQKKNRSKTIEKLIKMKNQFRLQIDQYDTLNKKSKFRNENPEERRLPRKKTEKSIQTLMENSKNKENKSFLHKLKQKHKYCLVCEEIIMDSVIDFHEKQCQPLQNLLKDSTLTIQKVIEILNQKIEKITAQLSKDIQHVYEDIGQLQTIVKKSLVSRSNDGQSEDLFSSLIVVRCWELYDKLEWFKRMRNNAQEKLQKKAL